MANEGWTQTPNFILDNMDRMKPAVFKICMVVVRQTCGYIDDQKNRKEWDRLSTSRIMELSGLSNRTVIDAVEEAIKDGWIERRPAGQYFEYRVSPMKKVHSLDEKTYEESSQVTYEESSQVEPTYEKISQEPMKKLHTQKKERNKNIILSDQAPASDADEWFSAVCWLVYGHKDFSLLSKTDKTAIGKTIKDIRASPNGYTIDHLRAWYRDKWSNEWPGKQPGKADIQRPSLKQIKSGIGQAKPAKVNPNGFNAEPNKSIAMVGELEK